MAVGGTTVLGGSSTEGLRTITQIVPTPVAGWAVQVVGLDSEGNRAHVVRLSGADSALSEEQVASLADYPAVVAIVGHDDPSGELTQSAGYTLTVNGVEQPGGS